LSGMRASCLDEYIYQTVHICPSRLTAVRSTTRRDGAPRCQPAAFVGWEAVAANSGSVALKRYMRRISSMAIQRAKRSRRSDGRRDPIRYSNFIGT